MFSSATQALLAGDPNVEPKAYVESLKKRRAELEEELHALATRQNLCSQPNRLPTDILENTFMEHALEVYLDGEEDDKLRWVKIMQVCRHWRNVAVNYAPLWTRIVLSHPEFVSLMLARSKDALLTFQFALEQFDYYRKIRRVRAAADILTEMLSQTERFRSITLRSFRGVRESKIPLCWILSEATGYAPNLEDLTLINSGYGLEPMTENFLQGGAPVLQRLIIQRVDIKWEQLPLPATLTQLVLRSGHRDRPLFNEFYDALARLVSLQTLILAGRLLAADGSVNTLSSPLTFLSLKTLQVDDFTGALTQFFEIVRVPSVEVTKVAIYDHDLEAPAVDRCLENFRSTIDSALSSLQNMNRLCVRQFDREYEDTYGGASIELRCESRWEPEACPFYLPPSVTVEFGRSDLPLAEILPSYSKHFDLTRVKTLDVSRGRELTADAFLDAFSQLPNIERLVFTSIPVYSIFLAMGDDPAFGKDNKFDPAPEPQPYFPALFSIVLDNIDFEEGGTVAVDDTIYSLCWALNCRPFAHFVEEVRLVDCVNFGQAEFELFRNSTNPVIDIHWDGHGEGAGPDSGVGQIVEVQSGDLPGENECSDSGPA